MIRLLEGDALEVLRGLADRSAQALVTDPPAGIGFMGKDWDRDRGGRAEWVAWLAAILAESRRVLLPGAHALVWALPRTAHWTALALENAGFEIRDVVVHLFGTGFPKSLDVSKALDRAAGAQRPVLGSNPNHRGLSGVHYEGVYSGGNTGAATITAPATPDAARWAGWGTALKPAAEHWILARVPLEGTVAGNVLEHGTGALNIDGCRVAAGTDYTELRVTQGGQTRYTQDGANHERASTFKPSMGRWPANVVLSGDAPELLDAQSGVSAATQARAGGFRPEDARKGTVDFKSGARATYPVVRGDPGGASRFFYCAKASRAERGEGNAHPTVKPLELMRWLARLVTPPGGVVLDPFAGSGSTAVACALEGLGCIAIEREAEYVATARRRLRDVAPLFEAAR